MEKIEESKELKKSLLNSSLLKQLTLALPLLLNGCIYQARNGHSSWYEYDHPDSIVSSPTTIDDKKISASDQRLLSETFEKHYELNISGSILMWAFGWIREFPEALAQLGRRPTKIFTFIVPGIERMIETDRKDLIRAIEKCEED